MRIPDRWRGVVDGAVLVMLVLLAYGSALPNGWIWDDDYYVTENLTLRSFDGLVRIWSEPRSIPQYYPLVHSTFWLEYQLWGDSPFGFHLVNIALHALGAVLLWRFLKRLDLPGAWFCAALFAVHPVMVESVAWVTERKNVLSTAFALAAAIRMWDYSERLRSKDLVWSVLLFVFALLSKTVVASLPAVLLLILWWKRKPMQARVVLPLTGMLVVGGAMGWFTAYLERTKVGAEGAPWDFSLIDRCLIAGRALWFYAGKLVLPLDLTFIYPRWDIDSLKLWQYLYPAAALALPLALLLLVKRIGRGPLVAVLIFGGVLFPALGFLNVYPHRYSFVADHFQHHASIALLVLIGCGLSMLPGLRPSPIGPTLGPAGARQPRTALAGWTVILMGLAALSFARNFAYQDERTLWEDTVDGNPRASMAYNNLGILDFEIRDDAAAIRNFREAIRAEPSNVQAVGNLALVYMRQGRFAQAEPLLVKAVGMEPDYVGAHMNLGVVRANQGRYGVAIEHFKKANDVNVAEGKGEIPNALAGIGEAYYRSGELEKAQENLARAIQLGFNQPDTFQFYAQVMVRLRQTDTAIQYFERAMSSTHTSLQASVGMTWIRATHEDARYRSADQAIQLARRLEQSSARLDPAVLDAVAAAYAENGDFGRAATLARDAVAKALEARNPEMAERIEARLLGYGQQQPARTPGHPDY